MIEAQELHAPVDTDVSLFYRAWVPPGAKKCVILVHRGHEHSGRLVDVVENLGIADAAFFAWDARGHGQSPGDRGYAPSFARVVKDLDAFVRHVSATHGFAIEDMVVLGHSVGAVTVSAWVHDFAPAIRAMVLVTPALRVKLYVPFARTGLAMLQKLRGDKKSYVQSYVKPTMLTHDAEQARRYADDPLITRAIAVNVLLDLYEIAERIVADAGAIRVPTLVLSGGADWVVDVKEQQKFFDRLGSARKKMRVFDGMYHDLLHEAGRAEVLGEIRTFITESRRPPRLGERLRLRPLARLRLRERSARPPRHRKAHRSHVSRQHRLARHPAAENPSRETAARGHRAHACRRARSAHPRCRHGLRALRARRARGGKGCDRAPPRFHSRECGAGEGDRALDAARGSRHVRAGRRIR